MAKKIVPFVFSNRDCPACGGKRTIYFIDGTNDLNNKITSSTNGVYEVRCQKCDKEYIIEWDENVPYLADKDYSISNFEEMFTKNEKRNIEGILFYDNL